MKYRAHMKYCVIEGLKAAQVIMSGSSGHAGLITPEVLLVSERQTERCTLQVASLMNGKIVSRKNDTNDGNTAGKIYLKEIQAHHKFENNCKIHGKCVS
jgi:hypothetical protein